MQDSVIAGTGNSRYIRSSVPADATLAEIITMLRAGVFPIDMAGTNAAGYTVMGTPLNKASLLNDATVTALGLGSDATPTQALLALIALIADKLDADQGSGNSGKLMGVDSNGDVEYITPATSVTQNGTDPVTGGAVYTAISRVLSETSATLSSANWAGSGPYTQTVTISGYAATANTRVDASCDSATLESLRDAGVSELYVSNSSGTLTVTCMGAKPTTNVTVKLTVFETYPIS